MLWRENAATLLKLLSCAWFKTISEKTYFESNGFCYLFYVQFTTYELFCSSLCMDLRYVLCTIMSMYYKFILDDYV